MSTKKLVLRVVADVKEAKEGLGEVADGVRNLFKLQQGAGREIVSGGLKAFDGLKGAMEKVMPVAGAVLAVTEKAIEMAQFAGQREVLLRQVGGPALEGLRAATQGLVDDQTLLQAAAKATRGDFKLSAEQMQNVAAAAVTLHNEGFGPIPQIIEEITNALAQGEGEALKKYGIALGETGTKTEKLGRAHAAMATLATSANNKLNDAGSETTKLLVRLKNAWDDVKVAIGFVVDVLARGVNALIDVHVAVGDFIGQAAAWVVTLGGLSAANDEVYTSVRGVTAATAEVTIQQQALNTVASTGVMVLDSLTGAFNRVAGAVNELTTDGPLEKAIRAMRELPGKLNDPMTGIMPNWKKEQEAAKKFLAEQEKDWKDFTKSLDGVMDHRLELVKNYEESERRAAEMVFGMWKGVSESINEGIKARNAALAGDAANENVKRMGALAKDLKAIAKEGTYAEQALRGLKASGKQALTELGVAAGTALQAIISGNKGAQVSLAEVFKALLDQLGTEMQINALKYLAMGTAALVTNPAAAPNLFAAAGIFEAAALAAGVAQRATGSPAGTGSGSANDNSAAAGHNRAGQDAAASAGGGSVTVIHQYNVNGFIGDEARLAREMERRRRHAELSGVTQPRAVARRG